ncbi:MAG: protein jag [Myxococcota bacterium]
MSKTYSGRNVEVAVAQAAKELGVDPSELNYDVLAGQAGGFALIRIKRGAGGAGKAGKAPVEKLSGDAVTDEGELDLSSAPEPDDREERRERKPRRDRDRDRGRGGRGDGGRGERREKKQERGGGRRRRVDYAVPPVPTDGPTEVVMEVDEDTELSIIGEDAHEVIRDLLTGMGFGMTVHVEEDEDTVRFDLDSGEYHEALIANEMQLLESLQYLIDRIVNFDAEHRKKIILDSRGAKKEQDEDLGRSALELADKAKEDGKTYKMGPLDPRARRVVHMALKNVGGVDTRSEGEGVFRRVCIIPK